jgi:hypothetical protein
MNEKERTVLLDSIINLTQTIDSLAKMNANNDYMLAKTWEFKDGKFRQDED